MRQEKKIEDELTTIYKMYKDLQERTKWMVQELCRYKMEAWSKMSKEEKIKKYQNTTCKYCKKRKDCKLLEDDYITHLLLFPRVNIETYTDIIEDSCGELDIDMKVIEGIKCYPDRDMDDDWEDDDYYGDDEDDYDDKDEETEENEED